jgi:valyl-tRNA synthetase
MKPNLSKPYDPKAVETAIYQREMESGFFAPEAHPPRADNPHADQTFTIMMAPPNITGHIHIGHALENILSDVLIRKRRMEGYKALFLPGKDHAGIAAQYVVERKLRKENKTRFDLGKEKFLERMEQWMRENGDAIDKELMALGLSCDWSRKRFTMDEQYQEAVKAAFKHYHKKGLIYRGKRIVNWCSRCQTSISDLEVVHTEEQGTLWYIAYPFADGSGHITVATTRPETMLGDTAVAVNPKDERYKNIVGKTLVLPIQGREIPIIADKAIDPSFGTGAVKVTPAHDALDFEIAERHKLPSLFVINEQGRMTREAGSHYAGLKVSECRERLLEQLKELGVLEREEPYIHNVGRCERCDTVIEPLLSKQWFLSMRELAKKTIKAIKQDQITFVPAQRKRIALAWLAQLKDWNISRQLWWGHAIPLPDTEDVLDTWFSSALWPFATLGWPEKTKDITTFYPTSVISSAREIFFLWIIRMIYSGIELTGSIPFRTVYTHATILDAKGQKMSKSIGNVVDPVDMIEKYGVDALRFGLIWQTSGTQDIHWSETALTAGKKFLNKMWNASRFVLTQSGITNNQDTITKQIQNSKFKIQNSQLTKYDKQILDELKNVMKATDKHLEQYEFGAALHGLYDFFWHQFCDVYLEAAKKEAGPETPAVLLHTLTTSLKLLHPFLPFITEEIWSQLPIESASGEKKLLFIEEWPS